MALTSNAFKSVFPVFTFLFLLISQFSFAQTRVVVNPGLEFGVANATVVQHDTNFGFGNTFDAGSGVTSPWYTSHTVQAGAGACASGVVGNCHPVEVWGTGFTGNATVGPVQAAQGTNFVELNAFVSSMIYQNMYLTNNDVITFSFKHRARNLTSERAAMVIEDQNQTNIATVRQTALPSSTGVWSDNSGIYTFTGTSGVYRVGFRAVSDGGSPGAGNLLDDIRITLNPLIDLKFTNALSSCEGSSNGNLFLRINGAVIQETKVAVQLVNPANGLPFITDSDINVTPVTNSNGTPTVVHTPGSTIYLITIPPGNYDGGATPGFSSPSNDEDGIALNIASVNDGINEPTETFKFEIRQQGTNGSTTNFVSTLSPIFGDTYYGSSNNYYINNCPDSDGDGILDVTDLDDDNDGILDTVENVCTTKTEGTAVYSNDFGVGAASTVADPNVIGHTLAAGDPQDGTYIVTTSNARTATYTKTNLSPTLNKDAGFTTITGGTVNGRYLMINVGSAATLNLPIYRISNLNVVPGRNYRFRIDMAGLADALTDVPSLQLTIKDAINNTVLATANSNSIGMANDDVWRRLSMEFAATSSVVTLEIVNLQGNGGNGNDLGLDNIVLAPYFCDADGDGIPNALDLDSDGDGCFDAVEGDENVLPSQLNANGSINTATTGGVGTTAGTNNGVPNLVNSGGTADIGADAGQGIGDSQNSGINAQCVDSDGDGLPDNLDLDDDNDGILDCIERGLGGATVSTVFQLKGNASQLSANEARLTPDTVGQAGQMWSNGKVDFAKSFTLSYRAYLGTKDATGADGMAAVFHNSPLGVNAVGGSASGLGAQGIANGIVLEIDTYDNGSTFGDIVNDHGQIWVSNNQTSTGFLTTASDLGNLENGVNHNVVINWNFTTKTLSYTVDGINAGSYTFPAGNPITGYFGGVSKVYFGYTASTGDSSNDQRVSFVDFCSDLPIELDTDNDGIPNHLDLDSDGDGCFDALEGDENVTLSHLNVNGSINTATTGGLGATTLNNGVPNLVNSGGSADIGGDVGQGIGDSQNALINTCYCYKKPVLNAGVTVPTRHGITALNRANSGATDWPIVRQSAWTVLEANTKGFVVNRVAFSDADANPATPTTPVGIPAANYVEGMMVYDTVANCLKIYNGTVWNCYTTQACPQ